MNEDSLPYLVSSLLSRVNVSPHSIAFHRLHSYATERREIKEKTKKPDCRTFPVASLPISSSRHSLHSCAGGPQIMSLFISFPSFGSKNL